MKFRLLFCFSTLLILAFSSTVTACQSSCENNCYYWDEEIEQCVWACWGEYYYCCGGECQECCYDGDCSGCEICVPGGYYCEDSDDECTGCKSCVNAQCIDDNDNCPGSQVCCNGQCKECCDHDDCPGGCCCCGGGYCEECCADPDCYFGEHCCDDKKCKECCQPSHCDGDEVCCNNYCEECCDYTDCGSGEVCCDNECKTGDCCDTSDCSACYYCYHWECKCNEVTDIDGISGPYYYQEQQDNITADLARSLRPGCSIYWGGYASISGGGTNVTATFNSVGENLTIHARTECQSPAKHSTTFTVAKISQFYADPSKFPKCKGDSIWKDDFIIVTDPTGYENEVSVTGMDTSSIGEHTAEATLWGFPYPTLKANYMVKGPDCDVFCIGPNEACCDDLTRYNTSTQQCCGNGNGKLCFSWETCCGDSCIDESYGFGCCDDQTVYSTYTHKCCELGDGTICGIDEECCDDGTCGLCCWRLEEHPDGTGDCACDEVTGHCGTYIRSWSISTAVRSSSGAHSYSNTYRQVGSQFDCTEETDWVNVFLCYSGQASACIATCAAESALCVASGLDPSTCGPGLENCAQCVRDYLEGEPEDCGCLGVTCGVEEEGTPIMDYAATLSGGTCP